LWRRFYFLGLSFPSEGASEPTSGGSAALSDQLASVWGNCWNCGAVRGEADVCAGCGRRSDEDPLVGVRLGPVRLREFVGASPGTNLYLANYVKEGSGTAAVRVLPASLKGNAAAVDALHDANLRQKLIQSEHVCRALHVGRAKGKLSWIVLGWPETVVPLVSVLGTLGKVQLGMGRASRLAGEILSAVQELHSEGVAHGRISPHSFILDGDGDGARLQLIDTGRGVLADSAAPGVAPATEVRRRPGWKGAEAWNVYQAPESLRQGDASPESDVYAAAVLVYQLFTSRLPYRLTRHQDILAAIRHGRQLDKLSASHRRAELKRFPQLLAVLDRALDERPGARYHAAEDLRIDLLAACQGGGGRVAGAIPGGEASSRAPKLHSAISGSKSRAGGDSKQSLGRITTRERRVPAASSARSKEIKERRPDARQEVLSRLGVSIDELHRASRELGDLGRLAENRLSRATPTTPGMFARWLDAGPISAPPPDSSAGAAPVSRPAGLARTTTEIAARRTAPDTGDASRALVCASIRSDLLVRKGSGTMLGPRQLEFRRALEPLREMAARVVEAAPGSGEGWMTLLLDPTEPPGTHVGKLLMFLMQFERTHRVRPPAMSLCSTIVPTKVDLKADPMQEKVGALAAEAQVLAAGANQGEIIATAGALEPSNVAGVFQPVAAERFSDLGAQLMRWQFVSVGA
jgi:serine/threonine protein kinase